MSAPSPILTERIFLIHALDTVCVYCVRVRALKWRSRGSEGLRGRNMRLCELTHNMSSLKTQDVTHVIARTKRHMSAQHVTVEP